MSSNNSSFIVESPPNAHEIVDLTTTTSPTLHITSPSGDDFSSITNEFTTERVCRLLSKNPENYKVIKNTKNNLTSICWNLFGIPTRKILGTEEFEPIQGFVSCESCFQTYAFSSTSGTRVLNSHTCVQKFSSGTRKRSSSESGTNHQMKLETITKSYKDVRLPEKPINIIKELTCKWVCQDMRPFSIVEDIGLENLLQEFINIGATYGKINVKNVLRGADVVAKQVYKLADDYRAELRELLKEPYENNCICVSPDMWSDPYKQISYMGISISFTDKNFIYKSVDICCRPYLQQDHTGSNILLSIQQCLEPFGLIDFDKLTFVSDRGPNLVCALRRYNTLFCYPHRLNNILKRSFFQTERQEKKKKDISSEIQSKNFTGNITANNTINSSSNDGDDSCSPSTSSSDDDDDVGKTQPLLPIKYKKNNKNELLMSKSVNDPRKMKSKDLHPSAQQIINTITRCKNLVRYVKKSGCNKDIQSNGGVALQQSTVVRWLSLINLLESIVRSYKATKRVLINRKQNSKLNGIDVEILKELIRLLKPFKHILKIVQTTNTPSLYMVLICTLMLRKTLGSFEELLEFHQSEPPTNDSIDDENSNSHAIEDTIESEGIQILRLRILELLNMMFELDVRHYASTLLHPRYRKLKDCTKTEREQTYTYIRKCMKEIEKEDKKKQQQDREPPQKKRKLAQSFLQQFEDDSDYEQSIDGDDVDGNEDFSMNLPKVDELARYSAMEIDKSTLTNNPLDFWRINQNDFPLLSRVARQIHSIPASSAAVERQFSGAGLVINERRTSLHPDQVDNILFIRSMQKMKLAE
ncbi:unnamed protein product [Adineta ricciae]|uniref:HAT C-terminal dimerisation domain-containing protein n=1 Tax=Adineta ricciae TaxID=249248 RepID=A0A814JYB7_ADIRI|nr:unnamed protein product [Adineta ricciae]CAF1464968.1 unnamed protein product [Adineta ricciae]